jgi:hypothetical protein
MAADSEHTGPSTITSMTVSDTSLLDGTKCTDEVRDSFPMNGSTETLAYFVYIACALRPRRVPAHAERWVLSVKVEYLSRIILFGERSLRRAMKDYIAHYHTERNHQGEDNMLLFHQISKTDHDKPVRCRDRLGELLRYYHQEAA